MSRFTSAIQRSFSSHTLLKVLVLGGSVALLGAACWKGVGTNTNVGVGNGDANVNTNSNTNSTGEIDTSDWLTYTNEEYGFSFRYPGSMAVDGHYGLTSNFNTPDTFTFIRLNFQEQYPTPIFSVSVAINEFNTTIDQIMQPDVSSSKSKDATVLGGKNVTVVYIAGPEGDKVIYAYPVGDKTVLISVPDGPAYVEIANTFMFTE